MDTRAPLDMLAEIVDVLSQALDGHFFILLEILVLSTTLYSQR